MFKGLLALLIYIFSFPVMAQLRSPELMATLDANLSTSELAVLYTVQRDVEQKLPPLMKERLFKLGPKSGFSIIVNDTKEHIAGSSNRRGEIHISRALLTQAEQLTKTLIHEWAHLYDFINFHPSEIYAQIDWCSSFKDQERTSNDIHICDLLSHIKSSVSSTPEFQEVAGWSIVLNGKGRRNQESSFSLRTPDRYEQKSPAEMFAVNMEYFLTDSEFQCRRPSLNRFLTKHFNFVPFATRNCSDFYRIVDPAFSDAKKALIHIDRSRLYQVHYLLASGGDSISSRFGHSMFRLVICSPTRSTVGPECLKDIQHHIVLSFRAAVNTPEVSQIAGLNGTYPSRLFFIPFSQVIEEYNKTELRDLMSYPLELNQNEVTQFLERSIETHWAYDGQYYFLSNNCAIESLNLIRSSLLKNELMTEVAQTPKWLLSTLSRYKLVNEQYLTNRAWAIDHGFLFVSHAEHLNKALAVISHQAPAISVGDIDSWMSLGGESRRNLFQKHLPRERQNQVKYAAAFLLLESHALKRSELSFQNNIIKILGLTNLDEETKVVVNQILAIKNGLVENKGQLKTPSQMLQLGYGLPSPQEQLSMRDKLEKIAQIKTKNSANLDQLYKKIYTPKSLSQILQVQDNMALFTQAIVTQ